VPVKAVRGALTRLVARCPDSRRVRRSAERGRRRCCLSWEVQPPGSLLVFRELPGSNTQQKL